MMTMSKRKADLLNITDLYFLKNQTIDCFDWFNQTIDRIDRP